MQHKVPDYPFQKLAADFCDFGASSYLVVADYFSKWLEIIEMKSKSTEEVIAKFRILFSNFGIPEEVMSDNIPFNALSYRQFSQEYDFKITTSSPI